MFAPPQKQRSSLMVPRADMIKLQPIRNQSLRVPIAKKIRKTKPTSTPLRPQASKKSDQSIVELLGAHVAREACATSRPCSKQPRNPIRDTASYMQKLQTDVSEGRLLLHGSPWVVPEDAFRAASRINEERSAANESFIESSEALHLILRPTVFVWAPQKLLPGFNLRCPCCNQRTNKVRWCRARVLHRVDGQCLYVATRHTCQKCPANPRQHDAAFQSDAPDVIATLPESLRQLWPFMDTGRNLIDTELATFCSAMSLRSSWAAIASVVQEMKATRWMRESTVRYLKLCKVLNLQPTETPKEFPAEYKLSEDWVRELCIREFHRKEPETFREIFAEEGDDVLAFDWTQDAASRCGGKFLFNVMSGARKVLASAITKTCGPHEIEPVLWQLKRRAVEPKVAYVDDECCGAWRVLLRNVWPAVAVRLDGFHALRRLTQTTTSTQHPWHGTFCAMLSNALYKYDAGELHRLQEARAKASLSKAIPKWAKAKYIPRVIVDEGEIERDIESVIKSFVHRSHDEMGPLITPQTHVAWENLRAHVRAGCLCDPPGLNMNVADEEKVAIIGGDIFKPIKTLRGASALEGFHSHQKQWLGMLAHHSMDAGLALIAEGTLRWNRKRANEASGAESETPMVFARGLLHEANGLHQHLTGQKLYPAYRTSEDVYEAPVCCMTATQK